MSALVIVSPVFSEQTELLPKDSQLRDKYVDEILACIRRQYRGKYMLHQSICLMANCITLL